MTETASLIERLRRNSTHPDGDNGIVGLPAHVIREAASTITRLEQERDEAQEQAGAAFMAHRKHAETLRARLEAAQKALTQIVAQQTDTVEWLRAHHIVFDGPLGADPKNWQHVAFSIYTDLAATASCAIAALDSTHPAGPTPESNK